jgi:hypothetical protein
MLGLTEVEHRGTGTFSFGMDNRSASLRVYSATPRY